MAVSRLRQAWHALKRSRDAAEEVKRVGLDTADMDELLPSAVLDDIEARHWNRYKLTWPPEMSPAETVASRVARESEKRTLAVAMRKSVPTLCVQDPYTDPSAEGCAQAYKACQRH